MEFLDNINKIIDKENKKIEEYLIENFKRLKEEGRSKEYVIDTCINLIYENFIETNFIKKYSYHFERAFTLFLNSFDNYNINNNNIDIIKQILKNEIKDEFQNFSNIKKISNRHYDNDFDTITFEIFSTHLLKLHCAKKIINNLSKNKELYYIFYETNDYTKFTIEEFKDNVINSKIYRKLFSKHYPKKILPEITKNNSQEIFTNEQQSTELLLVKNEDDKKVFLNDLENQLLIFLFKKIIDNGGFDTVAEMYHVLSFINISPASNFKNTGSYRSTKVYLAFFGKINDLNLNKINLKQKQRIGELKFNLNELTLKLKPYKLKNINEEIKKLQLKLIK